MKRCGLSGVADGIVPKSALPSTVLQLGAVLLLLILAPALLATPAHAGLSFGRYSTVIPVPDGFRVYSTGMRSGQSSGGVRAVAVQRDAKIVIGGDFAVTRGGRTWNYLARINPDGSLDTGFRPVLDGPVRALALQGDLIYIGGSFRVPGNGLGRLRGDGSADPAFTWVAAAGLDIGAILLQGDPNDPRVPSIIAGGVQEDAAGVKTAYLAGANSSGASLWSHTYTLAGPGNAEVDALLLLPDGELLAGGKFRILAPAANSLARFTVGGTCTGSFSGAAPGGGSTVSSLALQADGKIVVGGDFSFSAGSPAQSYRYLARYARDSGGAWNPDGFNPVLEAPVASIAVQPDGKILVAGGFAGRLKRLKLAGATDASFAPDAAVLNDVVRAVVLQPDGKILAGGDFDAATEDRRTFLARFYSQQGALDRDIPLLPIFKDPYDQEVRAISQSPDGTATLSADFAYGGVSLVPQTIRLKEDFNIDPGFHQLVVNQSPILVLAPLFDDSLVVAGHFSSLDTVWNGNNQRQIVRVSHDGDPDPYALFNADVNLSMHSSIMHFDFPYVFAVSQLPRGTLFSDGTSSEDGMFYAGGIFSSTPPPYKYLARFYGGDTDNPDTGKRDPRFNPVALCDLWNDEYAMDDQVMATAILPGGKVLAATYFGKLMLLSDTGALENYLQVTYDGSSDPSNPGSFTSVTLERDGKHILVGGSFLINGTDENGEAWQCGNLMRVIPESGSFKIDTKFNVEVQSIEINSEQDDGAYPVSGIALQTDGGMLIYGSFNWVKDAKGNRYRREYVARLKSSGELDAGFDLGHFEIEPDVENMIALTLQPDGKPLMGGFFTGTIGGHEAHKLARYSYGWSSDDLRVSQDGSTITWLRGGAWQDSLQDPLAGPQWGGTGPELWQAWFEYSYHPDPGPDQDPKPNPDSTAAAASWTFLGNAERITDPERIATGNGWKFAIPAGVQGAWKAAAAGDPSKATLYLRGRGYASGASGSGGSLVQSVRIHRVAPGAAAKTPLVITVNATRVYGSAELPTVNSFGHTGTLAAGDRITGVAVLRGEAPPDPTCNGDCTGFLKAAFALPGSDDTYTISYRYNLTIQPVPITIAVRASRPYGTAGGPPFTRDFSITAGSLATGVGISRIDVLMTSTRADTPAGAYPEPPSGPCTGYLSAVFDPPGSAANYDITYQYTLTITKIPLVVTAEDKTRAYLAPNPPLTAVYTGFANGESLADAAISGSPSLSTPAGLESPVGGYPIAVSVDRLSAANYSFTPVNGTLNVVKSCQEIIFPQPGDRTFGDPPSVVQASACSELGITLSLAGPGQGVASISGNVLTITGAGSIVITASQGGNGDLIQAPEVSRTLVVHKSGQQIDFPPLPQKLQGEPPFALGAASSSGLPVGYLSSDPSVAEISGDRVTIKGAGIAVITAVQPGDDNYNPALPSSRPLVVAEAGAPPVLSLSTLESGAVTANPVLNVMGTAYGAAGIVSLTLNGADLTGRGAPFSSCLLLVAGGNSIEVSARDGAGNRTTETLSITLDPSAPEIFIGAPADNSVADLPQFSAGGTVTPGSTVSIAVNGAPPRPLAVSDGAFTGGGTLRAGLNTLEFSASLAGKESRVKRSITLAPGGPVVAILEPAEDLMTERDSLTIRGSAAGAGASLALDVAGTGFAPALLGGGFQQSITLDRLGEFRITVRVTDAGGNSSTAQRNIVRVSRILGDLNGDGCVDLRDAAAALRISLGMEPVSAQALAHGDVAPLVNGVPQPDGKIDAGDVLVILRKMVGLTAF